MFNCHEIYIFLMQNIIPCEIFFCEILSERSSALERRSFSHTHDVSMFTGSDATHTCITFHMCLLGCLEWFPLLCGGFQNVAMLLLCSC